MKYFSRLNFFGRVLMFFLLLCSAVCPENIAAMQKNIAFLPLKMNAAKDSAYLKEGIRDILSNRLAVLADLKVIDKSVIDQALAGSLQNVQPQGIDALSRSLQADYLVAGSISIFQESISLDVTVYSGSGSTPKYFNTAVEQQGEIIKAIGKLAYIINEDVILPRKIAAREMVPPVVSPPPRPSTSLSASSRSTSVAVDPVKRSTPFQSRNVSRTIASLSPPQEVSGVSGFIKSPPIKVEAQALDVGDLDGDGKNEIVFASTYGIYVYQLFGNNFKLLTDISFDQSLRVLALTLADLDNDGSKEIYIGAADEDKPQSFALTLKNHGLDFIFKQTPWYIKAMDLPGEGWALLGQRAGRKTLLDPGIYRLENRGTELVAGQKLELPQEVNLFNFVLADLDGDRRSEVAAIDSKGYLNIFSPDNQLLWKSREQYGDGEKSFTSSKFIGDSDFTFQFNWERMPIQARLVSADINNDGLSDIVVNRNLSFASEFFEDMESAPVGSIHGLTWNGSALHELWHIDDFEGYITDYQMLPLVIPDEERPDWFRAGGELTIGLIKASSVFARLLPKKTTFLIYNIDFSDPK